jgi:hypothetical protein
LLEEKNLRLSNLISQYWTELSSYGNEQLKLQLAQEIISSGEQLNSDVGHSCLCLLLEHDDYVQYATESIEKALTEDFDSCFKRLLPLLGYAYQRNLNWLHAYIVYSVCARLDLFVEKNSWAAIEDKNIIVSLAEFIFYKEYNGSNYESVSVRSRMLYELFFCKKETISQKIASNLYESKKFQESMVYPDFIIVGSAKCGTTFLYKLICCSSQVWNREPKETHYFTNYFDYGINFYLRFFSDRPIGVKCGESSPDYFDICNPALKEYQDIAERIKRHLDTTKIIVILRNPAHRAIGLFNQMITNEYSSGSKSGEYKLDNLTFQEIKNYRNGYILESGKYILPLRRYTELFSSEQLLLIQFSELINVKQLSIRVSEFLDISVPNTDQLKDKFKNSGSHEKRNNNLYEQLREYYSQSLAELEAEYRISL